MASNSSKFVKERLRGGVLLSVFSESNEEHNTSKKRKQNGHSKDDKWHNFQPNSTSADGTNKPQSFYQNNRQKPSGSNSASNSNKVAIPSSQQDSSHAPTANDSSARTLASTSATTPTTTPRSSSENADSTGSGGDKNCPFCKIEVADGVDGIFCDKCHLWHHKECLNLSDAEYEQLSDENNDIEWFCAWCRSIIGNKIKWGEMEGEDAIQQAIQSAYYMILGWRKNLFSLPRGKCGTDFIKKLTELINLFVNKTKWQRIALSLVHIFVPIMLQKPSSKSRPRDHARYLTSRLERWQNGDLKSLMDETNEIQKRMNKSKAERKEQHQVKYFLNLMTFGKVGEAAKKINNDDSVKGVHPLDDEIKDILQKKHPKARDVHPETVLLPNSLPPEPVMYEEVTADMVQRTARNM